MAGGMSRPKGKGNFAGAIQDCSTGAVGCCLSPPTHWNAAVGYVCPDGNMGYPTADLSAQCCCDWGKAWDASTQTCVVPGAPQQPSCTYLNCPPPSTCNAQGQCVPPGPAPFDCTTCAPYLCNATQTACLTSCPIPTSTAGCFNGMTAEGNVNNICNLNNQCVSCPKCPLGEGCMWVINKGPQCGTTAI
jgi:hypothetical protein